MHETEYTRKSIDELLGYCGEEETNHQNIGHEDKIEDSFSCDSTVRMNKQSKLNPLFTFLLEANGSYFILLFGVSMFICHFARSVSQTLNYILSAIFAVSFCVYWNQVKNYNSVLNHIHSNCIDTKYFTISDKAVKREYFSDSCIASLLCKNLYPEYTISNYGEYISDLFGIDQSFGTIDSYSSLYLLFTHSYFKELIESDSAIKNENKIKNMILKANKLGQDSTIRMQARSYYLNHLRYVD